ncbi:uncharacterized protein C8orf59 homolog [Copidosoma floridanum]|uniref:uncharacterized protein C8orf59 homolog n=1 Tax=Copidosoma floridanum TaxID=29053 RepID=UPI0006C9A5AB|nr:uncharacterized protein C8orf59 homolog [Copidosoma floridanum]
MGKHKNKQRNVFKVSHSRAQKAKSKAKKVKTSLKKLDLGQGNKLSKEKTNKINKQLAEISKEIRQPKKKQQQQAPKGKANPIKLAQPVSEASKQQATNLIQDLKL